MNQTMFAAFEDELEKIALLGTLREPALAATRTMGSVATRLAPKTTSVVRGAVKTGREAAHVSKVLKKAPPGQLGRIARGGGTGPLGTDVARGAAQGLIARQRVGNAVRGRVHGLISKIRGR